MDKVGEKLLEKIPGMAVCKNWQLKSCWVIDGGSICEKCVVLWTRWNREVKVGNGGCASGFMYK